jgi:hypothetical protein
MEEIPLDDVTPNPDGSFTINKPGWYTLHGMPIAEVRDVTVPLVLFQKRELPKDEPIGNPVKWRSMNRAPRREAREAEDVIEILFLWVIMPIAAVFALVSLILLVVDR